MSCGYFRFEASIGVKNPNNYVKNIIILSKIYLNKGHESKTNGKMKCMELKNALYDIIVACGTLDRVNGLTTIQDKIITHWIQDILHMVVFIKHLHNLRLN